MSRPIERDSEGHYIGRRNVLEFVPRLAARDVGRALQDPRGCAYRLEWRPEDSLPARYGARGLDSLHGRLEPHGDGFRVTLADGTKGRVRIERRSPCGRGWLLFFRCPACNRATRFLYAVGYLLCRRCAGLRYRSEGHYLRRLGRRLSRATGRPISLLERGWSAHLRPNLVG